MCDPVTALTAAGSLLGFMQQSKAADSQEKAYRENYESQAAATQEQRVETQQQAAQQVSVRAREAMIERSRLEAAGLANGVHGLSVDAALREVDVNAAADVAAINANRESAQRQLSRGLEGARNNTTSRISSITRPSLAGVGLQIAGTYAGQQAKQKNRETKAIS